MPKVALVLGAGGFAGRAFHAGVLCALCEATGWDARDADLIVGTSAGSQTGALLRAGLSAADMAASQTRGPLTDQGRRLLAKMKPPPPFHPPGPRSFLHAPRLPSRAVVARAVRHPWTAAGVLATSFLPAGPIDTMPWANSLRPIVGDGWPERPLWICASRRRDGERVVFGRHGSPKVDVASAVAASCAIPGIFKPVEIGGVEYVDGGVHSPTNLDLVARRGFDLVIVVSPMSVARHVAGPRDLPLRRVFRLRLSQEANRVRRGGTDVVAFQPGAEELAAIGINALDPDPKRWRRVVELVRKNTLERLERDDVFERLTKLAA